MPHLIQLPLAGILGLGGVEIAIIIPIVGMIFGGIMGISAMIFSHRRRELWHETTRIALEKGQPLPPAEGSARGPRRPGARDDLRTGIIVLAVSVGLYIFFHSVAPDAEAIAAIPGCIGVALVLLGILNLLSGRKSDDQSPKT